MAGPTDTKAPAKRLRSRAWFDNPDNPGMTALYLERQLNYGLTIEELQSGKPIIGIAQTGSDLSPCNRHHIELAKRMREGVASAGGLGRRTRRPVTPTPLYAPPRDHKFDAPSTPFVWHRARSARST